MTEVVLAREIGNSVVNLGFDGVWTPARQQYAIHTDSRYIEVSKQQFLDVIPNIDPVVTSRSRSQTKGSGECSCFSLRHGQEVARTYSGGEYDSTGQAKTMYFLTVDFAQKMRDRLTKVAENQEFANATNAPGSERPRG